METLSTEYSILSQLSKDSEILNKQTKHKIVESLMIALTALQLADFFMKQQTDTILKSMEESMKQTEVTRTLIENKKTVGPNESSSKNFSYTEAVKLSISY